MASGCDPGRTVNVGSDIALGCQMRRSGVEADAHADRARSQRLECLGCRRQRARRSREGDEEGVALGVDLDTAVVRERRTEDAAVLGERVGICLRTQLVKEPGRALDVGEEEGNGSGRQISLHERMMT